MLDERFHPLLYGGDRRIDVLYVGGSSALRTRWVGGAHQQRSNLSVARPRGYAPIAEPEHGGNADLQFLSDHSPWQREHAAHLDWQQLSSWSRSPLEWKLSDYHHPQPHTVDGGDSRERPGNDRHSFDSRSQSRRGCLERLDPHNQLEEPGPAFAELRGVNRIWVRLLCGLFLLFLDCDGQIDWLR